MGHDKIRKALRWVTVTLSVAAFCGSYQHGVEWATEHGPDGMWAHYVAAMPEVMVLTAVMALTLNRRSPGGWVMGVTGVAWQLWVNGAAAEGGASGLVTALFPAWAAILSLTLTHGVPAPVAHPESSPLTQADPQPAPAVVARPADPEPMTQIPDPRPVAHLTHAERVSTGPRVTQSVTQRPTRTVAHSVTQLGHDGPVGDKLTQAVEWVKDQPTRPTRKAVMAGAGVSDSTAKRALAAVPRSA